MRCIKTEQPHPEMDTVLALLHTKHRKLLEDLRRAGVDHAKIIERNVPDVRPLRLKLSMRWVTDDRVEKLLEVVCPCLHYEVIDDPPRDDGLRRLSGPYGAWRPWMLEVCQTKQHLRCEYFLETET